MSIPKLPPELGRFDSIVDAYREGDKERLAKAVADNRLTIEAAMQNAMETIGRYTRTAQVLREYEWELADWGIWDNLVSEGIIVKTW